VTILVTRRYDPTGRTNLGVYVGGVCFLLYLGAIIGYWFFKILLRGAGSPDQEEIGTVPEDVDFRILKDWRTLFVAMADPEDQEARRISRGLRWHVILSFAITSFMVLALTGGAILLDWGNTGKLTTALWILLPPWFISQILIFLKARGGWDRMMKGLGLVPEGGPAGLSSFLKTEVVYGGTKGGRTIGLGVGQGGSVAWVESPSAVFNGSFEGGAFKLEGAVPPEVRRWCSQLPRLEAWKGIEIVAGPDGVGVRRQKVGTYLWLYDLWLADNIAQRSRRL
jgi:hypothetical protein